MLKKLLPIALLASMLMILGCPGQPCGPGQIIDCKDKCIDQSDLNDSVGNGTCDEAFNCSELDYDGGDCATTTTTMIDDDRTTTSTISTTTTSSTVAACDLDSLLCDPAVSIHNVVDEWGACQWINVSLGVDPQGCEGEFYCCATRATDSECVVINLKEEDAGEIRWIGPFRFDGYNYCYPAVGLAFELYIRNAQLGDLSECKKPPLPRITLPENDSNTYAQGENITFEGEAKLSYDGELTGDSLVWTSDMDGQIGTGNAFTRNDLSLGEHTITLTATDSFGDEGTNEVSIIIERTTPLIGIE